MPFSRHALRCRECRPGCKILPRNGESPAGVVEIRQPQFVPWEQIAQPRRSIDPNAVGGIPTTKLPRTPSRAADVRTFGMSGDLDPEGVRTVVNRHRPSATDPLRPFWRLPKVIRYRFQSKLTGVSDPLARNTDSDGVTRNYFGNPSSRNPAQDVYRATQGRLNNEVRVVEPPRVERQRLRGWMRGPGATSTSGSRTSDAASWGSGCIASFGEPGSAIGREFACGTLSSRRRRGCGDRARCVGWRASLAASDKSVLGRTSWTHSGPVWPRLE